MFDGKKARHLIHEVVNTQYGVITNCPEHANYSFLMIFHLNILRCEKWRIYWLLLWLWLLLTFIISFSPQKKYKKSFDENLNYYKSASVVQIKMKLNKMNTLLFLVLRISLLIFNACHEIRVSLNGIYIGHNHMRKVDNLMSRLNKLIGQQKGHELENLVYSVKCKNFVYDMSIRFGQNTDNCKNQVPTIEMIVILFGNL